MTILQDIQQLNAGNIVTLYSLDLSNCIGKFGQTPYVSLGSATVSDIVADSTGWTATLSGILSTARMGVGCKLVGFSAGSGKLYQGTPDECIITYVDTNTIKYKTIGGSAPTSGSITNLIGLEAFVWSDGINELGNDTVFNGINYTKYPIQATGFDKVGNGTIPRPKLTVSNIGGIIGSLTREYNDLAGAKLTRTRTFAKYLDAINFNKFNCLLHSSNLQNSIWVSYKTGTANGTYSLETDPIYGSVLRVTKTAGADTDRFGIRQNITGLSGTTYNGFSYVRKGTITSTGYAIYIDAIKTSGGYSTISAPINSSNTTINEWKKLTAISSPADLSGTASVYMWVEGPIGSYIDFAWPQVSLGTTILEYQPTGATWNQYADPTQILDKEIWTIDRKSNENSMFMEWELTAPFDLRGVKIPRRQCVQNMCNWKYKSSECSWPTTSIKPGGSTPIYFDIKDLPTSDPAKDICGKRLSSCKKRFGNDAVLPYGGFPAVGI